MKTTGQNSKYRWELEPSSGGLYRIWAVRDIPRYGVRVGDRGGLISCPGHSLSAEGDCWVSRDARVTCEAVVTDNALIGSNAYITDSARVGWNAQVGRNARVTGDSQVTANAIVTEDCRLGRDARVVGEVISYSVSTPSGQATLELTGAGYVLHVGCWDGTPESLRELVGGTDYWPSEPTLDEMECRRPILKGVADTVEALVTYYGETWA